MDGTVKVPGIGPVKKKTAGVVGVGIAGVLAILWWRQRQAASSATSSTTAAAAAGQVTDPAGNTCAALDAQTGYCPGTTQDTAAQAQLAAGGSLADADLSSEGEYYDPATGEYDLTSPYTGSTTGQPGSFTSNTQWSEYAEQAMGSTGADATAAALGKYLLGQALTADQVTVIEQAIAAAGSPPIAGTGGYPPSYKTSSTGTGTGTGSTAKPTRAPSGTKTSAITSSGAQLSWQPVSSAASYNVTWTEAAAAKGGSGQHKQGVTGTSFPLSGLKGKTRHTWSVTAVNSAGEGPKSGNVSFTTK